MQSPKAAAAAPKAIAAPDEDAVADKAAPRPKARIPAKRRKKDGVSVEELHSLSIFGAAARSWFKL